MFAIRFLERAHKLADRRATMYASLSSYFRVANVFSATTAFWEHGAQLRDPMIFRDVSHWKHLLGKTALSGGEAVVFYGVYYSVGKMVSFLVCLEDRWLTRVCSALL